MNNLTRVLYNACKLIVVDLIIPQKETPEIEFKMLHNYQRLLQITTPPVPVQVETRKAEKYVLPPRIP